MINKSYLNLNKYLPPTQSQIKHQQASQTGKTFIQTQQTGKESDPFVKTHLPCPCGSSHDAFSLREDGSGMCFGKCGGKNFSSKEFNIEDTPSELPEFSSVAGQTLEDKYHEHRGLSQTTMKFYGIKTRFVDNNPIEVSFPYEHFNKIRGYSEKLFRAVGTNTKDPGLFGMDKFDPGSKDSITITAGEYDAASIFQVTHGKTAAVSLPSGNKSQALKVLVKHRDYVNSFKKIYLALDNDIPDQETTKAISALFDFNKVYLVKFNKYKDANDYLQHNEGYDLFSVWDGARRYTPDNIISSFTDIKSALDDDSDELLGTYPFSTLNENTYGIHAGELILLFAVPDKQGASASGVGKQLPITTRVPTPNGWTTMGELKIGDEIFGPDGTLTKVSFVTPIQYNVPCYRIFFNDGTSQIAGGPHKWSVSAWSRNWKTMTTEEMYKQGVITIDKRGNKKAKFGVPIAKAVQLPNQELPIDPYILGYWLGDGHSYSRNVYVGDEDIDCVNFEIERKKKENCWNLWIKGLDYKTLNKNHLIQNKHIPSQYLRASEYQRRELLRGLMDSDGSSCANAGVEFYTSNTKILEGVLELIQSLGYAPRVRQKWLQGKIRYTIWFLVEKGEDVYKYQRKIDKVVPLKTLSRLNKKMIRDIQPVKSVPSVCIEVDHKDHLYLIENFLVTHNTEVFRALEHHLLKTTKHNIGIIHLEEGRKTTIQAIAGYELDIAATLPDCGLSKSDIFEGYQKALNNDDSRVHIYSSFDLQDENTFIDNLRFLGAGAKCRIIFLDHITWLATGLDTDDTTKKLDRLSQKLKLLAKELNIAIIMISHTNDDGRTRGSRNIENVTNTHIRIKRDKDSPDQTTKNTMHFELPKVRLGGQTGPAGYAIMDPISRKLLEPKLTDEYRIPL